MSEQQPLNIGSIGWMDLTIPDAGGVSAFYKEVVGWTSTEVDMGGYSDYCMNEPDGGKTVAGICHKQGVNSDFPSQWMIYITVADLDESLTKCKSNGGEVLMGPKGMGGTARYAIIRDPAGAVCALYQA